MTDVLVSPPTAFVLSAPYALRIRVEGVDFGQQTKLLEVTSQAEGAVYSWADGVITVSPTWSQTTEQGADTLEVELTRLAEPLPGDVDEFTITYSDDSTPSIEAVRRYCYCDLTFLARNPVPDQVDVPLTTSMVMAVQAAGQITFVSGDLYLNGELVSDIKTNGFLRPDYTGRVVVMGPAFYASLQRRRAFPEGTPIKVQWDVRVTPDSEELFTAQLTWTFYTVRRATVLQDPALQRTALDVPSPIGMIEIFRQAALDALCPANSRAAPAVMFYAAVQRSSLETLGPLLPNAQALAAETPHLRAIDLVSPITVSAKLATVEIFWPSLLQVLIREALLAPEVADLLDRAWRSGIPADRGGAAAAALLYAVQASI